MFQMISMVRDTSGDNMEVTSTDIQHKDDSEAAVSTINKVDLSIIKLQQVIQQNIPNFFDL